MKLKIILLVILAAVLGLIGISYYSHTPEGQYGLLVKNAGKHVESIAKSRDYGIPLGEAISWYNTEGWRREHPEFRECMIKGVRYVYSRPELTPEEIKVSYKRQIEKRKDYWMTKIKRRLEMDKKP
jgi:hypothetical protein